MKFPKAVNRYCPHCKKHTSHKVSASKKKTPGSAHPMSWGGKVRMALRGKCTGTGNRGRMSKGALSGWKRYGKKTSKKVDLRYTCAVCKKAHTQRKGFRVKRVEFQQ